MDATPSPSGASTPLQVPSGLGSASISSLQQEDQQKLMDEIDRLRSAGVNEFVSLPQLVVCGDQSSGKSSVLEAITEIPFPRRANLCTRFATQIMLRRGDVERATVRIIPFGERSTEEQQRLKKFTATIESFADLPDLIDKAADVMGVGGEGSTFARDTLSVEISGPDKPQLTIVDTPGLIHTETRGQTQADIQMVSDLVRDYMNDERTIILAVVSAKNDIANQVVLQRARAADPSGNRTLGIITKPDTAGCEMENSFVALARNEDIRLALGWHVLRNRSTEERDQSFTERNQQEQLFFQRRPWNSLPDSDTGIEALRVKLSWLLFDHIRKELPRVRQEITDAYNKASAELKLLGSSRSTVEEQRLYLIEISQKLGERCRAGVQGNYEDPFFFAHADRSWRKRRLRAGVQKDNIEFAETMRTSGHALEIESDRNNSYIFRSGNSEGPERLSRKQAIDWVRPFITVSRGRELPGSYNPLLIRELFLEQSKCWDDLARHHVNNVWKRCKNFVKTALADLAPADVVEALWVYRLEKAIDEKLKKANEELEELLSDKSSVITYNHYYTENIQKNRINNLQQQVNRIAQNAGMPQSGQATIDSGAFWKSLEQQMQANMDDFASEEALDSMLAYYKVALKTFVDNVSIIVVERRLLRDLPTIFTPSTVATMSPDEVTDIAGESPRQQESRKRLNTTIGSLKKGRAVFERAIRIHHGPRNGRGIEDSEHSDADDSDNLSDSGTRNRVNTTRTAATRGSSTSLTQAARSTPAPSIFQPANTSASSLFGSSAPQAVPVKGPFAFGTSSFGTPTKTEAPKPGLVSSTPQGNAGAESTSRHKQGSTGGSLFPK